MRGHVISSHEAKAILAAKHGDLMLLDSGKWALVLDVEYEEYDVRREGYTFDTLDQAKLFLSMFSGNQN